MRLRVQAPSGVPCLKKTNALDRAKTLPKANDIQKKVDTKKIRAIMRAHLKIMKNNNEETSCEQSSSLTTVNTTYARICVLLLALNFGITGYVLTGVLKLQQETSLAVLQTRATAQATPQATTEGTEGPETVEGAATPSTAPTGEVKTLGKED